MKPLKIFSRAFLGLFAIAICSQLAAADQVVWSMASAGNGHLYSIDTVTNTTTFYGSIKDPVLGDVGGGWSTIAETPDKTLFFLRRFQNDINVYSVSATNIQSSGGVITNVQSLGATGLAGNLDGLTAGPDGNLYLTSYDNSNASHPRNGLFRFNPLTASLTFVGTFANDSGPGGSNSFYTDLAFDPITGNLYGTGYDSNGAFGIYVLNGASVLSGNNQTFTFNRAFNACGADGLAFDRLTGQLFESDDSGGVRSADRTTGACTGYIGNTKGTELGSDLAVQSDTIPNPVPEPGSLALLGSGLIGALGAVRKRFLN